MNTNPALLRRRMRLVTWLSSIGGGLATAAIVAGVAHSAANASSTPATGTSTSTSTATSTSSTPEPSTSTATPSDSNSGSSGDGTSSSSDTGSSIDSADQHTAPQAGSNGS